VARKGTFCNDDGGGGGDDDVDMDINVSHIALYTLMCV
jgi:hypothetical protein